MSGLSLAMAGLAASLTLSPSGNGVLHRLPAATRTTAVACALLRHSLSPAAMRFGQSIGSPADGRLLGGAHLDATSYLHIVPVYEKTGARWGLEPLVVMIRRAARTVRQEYPNAITTVGDLSLRGGGDIDRHRSHESGRDADLGFFVKTSTGKQLFAPHFVPFRPDGTAVGWPGAHFDDAKNWALVAALVDDPTARITHLFVARPLRARLLAYAERIGARPALRARAAELLQQPGDSLPHDDHFHVRIGCPPHMTGCVENSAPRAPRAPTAQVHHRATPRSP